MTNEKLIQIVNDELEMYMRDDIRMRIHYHKTGITACFRAFLGYRGTTPEYAIICNVRLHRIMKAESVRRILRRIANLYPDDLIFWTDMPSAEQIAFVRGEIV